MFLPNSPKTITNDLTNDFPMLSKDSFELSKCMMKKAKAKAKTRSRRPRTVLMILLVME